MLAILSLSLASIGRYLYDDKPMLNHYVCHFKNPLSNQIVIFIKEKPWKLTNVSCAAGCMTRRQVAPKKALRQAQNGKIFPTTGRALSAAWAKKTLKW